MAEELCLLSRHLPDGLRPHVPTKMCLAGNCLPGRTRRRCGWIASSGCRDLRLHRKLRFYALEEVRSHLFGWPLTVFISRLQTLNRTSPSRSLCTVLAQQRRGEGVDATCLGPFPLPEANVLCSARRPHVSRKPLPVSIRLAGTRVRENRPLKDAQCSVPGRDGMTHHPPMARTAPLMIPCISLSYHIDLFNMINLYSTPVPAASQLLICLLTTATMASIGVGSTSHSKTK